MAQADAIVTTVKHRRRRLRRRLVELASTGHTDVVEVIGESEVGVPERSPYGGAV